MYTAPNIRVIKSRRMTWAGHGPRMGNRGWVQKFWSENLKGRPLGIP